jgi:hypothetical protein
MTLLKVVAVLFFLLQYSYEYSVVNFTVAALHTYGGRTFSTGFLKVSNLIVEQKVAVRFCGTQTRLFITSDYRQNDLANKVNVDE